MQSKGCFGRRGSVNAGSWKKGTPGTASGTLRAWTSEGAVMTTAAKNTASDTASDTPITALDMVGKDASRLSSGCSNCKDDTTTGSRRTSAQPVRSTTGDMWRGKSASASIPTSRPTKPPIATSARATATRSRAAFATMVVGDSWARAKANGVDQTMRAR